MGRSSVTMPVALSAALSVTISVTPEMVPGEAASEELRPLPLLPEHVLVEEGEHRLVPDASVLRLQDPVVLVGEVQELAFDAVARHVRPQAQGLADRDAVVLLAVYHEQRCADIAHQAMRRGGLVARRVLVGVAELALPPGAEVGRAVESAQLPQAGVGHDCLE